MAASLPSRAESETSCLRSVFVFLVCGETFARAELAFQLSRTNRRRELPNRTLFSVQMPFRGRELAHAARAHTIHSLFVCLCTFAVCVQAPVRRVRAVSLCASNACVFRQTETCILANSIQFCVLVCLHQLCSLICKPRGRRKKYSAHFQHRCITSIQLDLRPTPPPLESRESSIRDRLLANRHLSARRAFCVLSGETRGRRAQFRRSASNSTARLSLPNEDKPHTDRCSGEHSRIDRLSSRQCASE